MFLILFEAARIILNIKIPVQILFSSDAQINFPTNYLPSSARFLGVPTYSASLRVLYVRPFSGPFWSLWQLVRLPFILFNSDEDADADVEVTLPWWLIRMVTKRDIKPSQAQEQSSTTRPLF